MKKILIIYEPKTHIGLISRLLDNMKREGIDIDAFNIRYQFYHSGKHLPFLIRLFSYIPKNRLSIFLLRNLCYNIILRIIQKEYDILDIHYFSRPYVRFLKNYKKPYKLSIWGSDFYRESLSWQENKRDVYRKASVIQVETITVKRDLIAYENSLADKIYVCNFGIDILDNIESSLNQDDEKPFIPNKAGKIVVTCGYNGGSAQQHIKIFSQINKLSEGQKEKILLCVPATYGLESSYETELVNMLESLSVEYVIIKNRLSENEIAKLRIETDIVINMQISDSLSSSLLEHLFAGNVLLLGNWLPTDTYDVYGIYYRLVDENNLTLVLGDVVDNLLAEKSKCKGNYEKIKDFATWDSVRQKQLDIYRQFIV